MKQDMDHISRLKKDYPWIQTPLIVGAPMRLIALADMAVEISKAGGIGFIGAGTDVSDLSTHLEHAQTLLSRTALASSSNTLPIGIGFINWGADLAASIALIAQYRPSAVWFFAPASSASLADWTAQTRRASPHTKIWVQVGCVRDAVDVVREVQPDVLVVQGTDAGGHGLARGASLVSLLPETIDTLAALEKKTEDGSYMPPTILAAGGIAESRGVLAALSLGAAGVVMGTRFLAAPEAQISRGYQAEILRAGDGGQTTVRTKVYDTLRGTTGWAETHNARGVINRGYVDAEAGMAEEEGRRLYALEMQRGDGAWGVDGRMTTYAGSSVGLVREVKGAGEIVREVREGVRAVLDVVSARL
ncbi:inosine monophosphate dehydrogenase [Dothidotthia symphoricarpi CBS 119687]|uniref:Inosine monophosphate dehydrogenase n=1 Tax=Dothidotthia symphoricarpi CBS 119687 TaxID=1392245 RepID=A0A6A6AQ83_9PLEO|nr:inosine monophosphate dehydrogenase [Dothidotthia symphoricarpi CBS 119687]KAF2134162.1 inosine monophosphate dehydrogenase [Dothidotthia symphoricarpi CBS 119687]